MRMTVTQWGRALRRVWARRRFPRGFTIIELLAVLLVLALLAVTAVMNLGKAGANAIAEADTLRSVLRYAQSRAMADVYTWGVVVSSSGYRLFSNNPDQTDARLPSQGSNVHTVADGVTLAGDSPIIFDWRGVPVSNNVTTPGSSGTPQTAYQAVNVHESGSVQTVIVTPYTGFVP